MPGSPARRRTDGVALAAGLAAGLLADTLLGDPRRGHPVAGFGQVAGRLERLLWRPSRAAGALYVAALVVPPVAVAHLVDRRLRHRPGQRAGLVAATCWAVLGAASLGREAAALRRALPGGTHPPHRRPPGRAATDPSGTDRPEPDLSVEGRPAPGQPAASGPAADLTAARARLPHLCGRDPAVLDRAGLVRATIESVAENTSDAAVAPLFWGALVGPAGLVGYRAVNTLDAMVGHLSARHREFGWAAARLDDLANLAPARLTAALAAALAPAVGGGPAAAWRAWRRDAPAHPSPNAGPCEAAFAGALGVRLGGPTTYSYGHSDRPWLGTGREPSAADIDRAVTLSGQVTWSAAALCAGYALIAGHLARRPRGRAGLPRPAGPPVHAVRGGGRARFVGFARRWAVSWRVVGRLARPASGSRGGGRLRLVGPDHPWPGGGPRRPAGQCVPRGGRPDAVRTWGARWSISRRPGGGVEPGRPARRNRRVAR